MSLPNRRSVKTSIFGFSCVGRRNRGDLNYLLSIPPGETVRESSDVLITEFSMNRLVTGSYLQPN